MRPQVHLALLALTASYGVHANIITFYDFAPTIAGEPTQTGTYSFRAVGVGADGSTTYVKDFIWRDDFSTKRTVYTSAGVTFTTDLPAATPTAKTFTDQITMAANPTHYIYTARDKLLKQDIIKECFIEGSEGITCVWGARGGPSTTISGPAMPIYTIIEEGNTIAPRGPPVPPSPPPAPSPVDPPVAPSPVDSPSEPSPIDSPPSPSPVDPPVDPIPVNSPVSPNSSPVTSNGISIHVSLAGNYTILWLLLVYSLL